MQTNIQMGTTSASNGFLDLKGQDYDMIYNNFRIEDPVRLFFFAFWVYMFISFSKNQAVLLFYNTL